ncbi:MAG: arlR [Paenibacillaceae bacterium]|jgi:DNA-binding response OmpR family regulator|nr:arlR [Paenibacillaceae bacterium]
MNRRILIIEDEQRIARILELELTNEGYIVELAAEGVQGLAKALQEEWSCILLDLQLPGQGGFQVLEGIREQDSRTPVLILTAREALEDKVKGLDLGANDYITKPFEFMELSARIRSQIRARLRDVTPAAEDLLKLDALTADLKTRQVQREGKLIDLTPREFDLLVFLLQHRDQPVSRETLLSEVWGFDFAGQTNLVDVYIRYLRQKVDQGFKKKLIATVRGVGYSIQEP